MTMLVVRIGRSTNLYYISSWLKIVEERGYLQSETFLLFGEIVLAHLNGLVTIPDAYRSVVSHRAQDGMVAWRRWLRDMLIGQPS